jgi:MerR family redox-sensitive transcriptional activator SoxR
MRWMTIGEVARKMGLNSSAIRYYEKRGLLPTPPRERGQRRYSGEVLSRLAIIRFSQHVGFRIREIRQLLDGVEARPPPERWRAMATVKLRQLESLMSRAKEMHSAILRTLGHHCPHLVEHGKKLGRKVAREPD